MGRAVSRATPLHAHVPRERADPGPGLVQVVRAAIQEVRDEVAIFGRSLQLPRRVTVYRVDRVDVDRATGSWTVFETNEECFGNACSFGVMFKANDKQEL